MRMLLFRLFLEGRGLNEIGTAGQSQIQMFVSIVSPWTRVVQVSSALQYSQGGFSIWWVWMLRDVRSTHADPCPILKRPSSLTSSIILKFLNV